MSTKIYNGYQLKYSDFRTLRTKLIELRPKMDKIRNGHLLKTMNLLAITKLDQMEIDETMIKKPLNEVKHDIKNEIWKELLKSEQSSTKNPPYDVGVDVTIIPLKHKTLALFYSHRPEHTDLWQKQQWVKDYHYQNQVDMPEGMTEKKWKIRSEDWDLALEPSGIPSQSGFSFVLCEQAFNIYTIKWDVNFKVCGTVPERAYKKAVTRTREEYANEQIEREKDINEPRNSISEFTRHWMNSTKYIQTPEALTKIEKYTGEYASKFKETYG